MVWSWLMNQAGLSTSDEPFRPSPRDVAILRGMLFKAKKVPTELTLIILDLAEYWPCSRTTLRKPTSVESSKGGNKLLVRCPPVGLQYPPYSDYKPAELSIETIEGVRENPSTELLQKYLKASLPQLEHPVRKIVFTIKSRDQGWASEPYNKYRGSWTWFDVGLERYDVAIQCPALVQTSEDECPHRIRKRGSSDGEDYFLPTCKLKSVQPAPYLHMGKPRLEHDLFPDPKLLIQSNLVANKDPRVHKITWSYLDDIDPNTPEAGELEEIGRGRATGTGEFVRDLRVGDVVTVWGKARFAGWVNFVEDMTVDIYWAF